MIDRVIGNKLKSSRGALLLPAGAILLLVGCSGSLCLNEPITLQPRYNTTMHGKRATIGYFYTFLNNGNRWMRNAEESDRRDEPYYVVLHATYASEYLRNARQYYTAIVTHGHTWGQEYAADVDRVRRDGKDFIGGVEADLRRLAGMKHRMFAKVAAADLFKLYIVPSPLHLTCPDPINELDVLAELAIRRKAADVLGKIARDEAEDTRRRIRAVAGYELIVAEATLLAEISPKKDETKRAALLGEVLRHKPEIDRFLAAVCRKLQEDGRTYGALLDSEREDMMPRRKTFQSGLTSE